MATEVISTIDSSGAGDYTSVASWIAACPSDLVSLDQVWVGEVVNEELLQSAVVTVGGVTTDATRFIHLRGKPGSTFIDTSTPGTTPLRYDGITGARLKMTANWTNMFGHSGDSKFKVSQLAMKCTGNALIVVSNSHTQPFIAEQFIADSNSSTGNFILFRNGSGDFSKLTNGVIICDFNGAEFVKGRQSQWEYCTFYNTSASPGSVVFDQYQATDFTNCLMLGTTDFQVQTINNNVDYCVTDLSSWESSTATNSVLNATASSEIKSDTGDNTTCDLTAKAGGDIDGAGTPISGVTVDIFGQTRSGSTPTIGAYELAGGPAPSASLLLMRRSPINYGGMR